MWKVCYLREDNDYWVWKSLQHYYPKVVCIEYNCNFEITESKTIEYDPNFIHDATKYYGVSALALIKLANSKGYTLVAHTIDLNLFFVRDELVSPFEKYDMNIIEKHDHHRPTERVMIDI